MSDLEVKISRFWVKNTSGKPDAALTLLLIAFFLSCALTVVGAIQEIAIGNFVLTFNESNVGMFATTVLIPLIGLYFGRRWRSAQESASNVQSLFFQNLPKKETKKETLVENKHSEEGGSDEVEG